MKTILMSGAVALSLLAAPIMSYAADTPAQADDKVAAADAHAATLSSAWAGVSAA